MIPFLLLVHDSFIEFAAHFDQREDGRVSSGKQKAMPPRITNR